MASLITLLSTIILISTVKTEAVKDGECILNCASKVDVAITQDKGHGIVTAHDQDGGTHTVSETYARTKPGSNSFDSKVGYVYQTPDDQGSVGASYGNNGHGVSGKNTWTGDSGGKHTVSGIYTHSNQGQDFHDIGYTYTMPNDQGGLSAHHGTNGHSVSGDNTWTGDSGGKHTVSGIYTHNNQGQDFHNIGYTYTMPNDQGGLSAHHGTNGHSVSGANTWKGDSGGKHTLSGIYTHNNQGQDFHDIGYTYTMPNDHGGLSAHHGTHGHSVSGANTWTGDSGGKHTVSGIYNHQPGPMGGENYKVEYKYRSHDRKHSFSGGFNHNSVRGNGAELKYTFEIP